MMNYFLEELCASGTAEPWDLTRIFHGGIYKYKVFLYFANFGTKLLNLVHHHHRISRWADVWPWGTPGGVIFASTSRIRSVFVIIALLI